MEKMIRLLQITVEERSIIFPILEVRNSCVRCSCAPGGPTSMAFCLGASSDPPPFPGGPSWELQKQDRAWGRIPAPSQNKQKRDIISVLQDGIWSRWGVALIFINKQQSA